MKKSEKNEFFQVTHYKDYINVKWFNGMKADIPKILIDTWQDVSIKGISDFVGKEFIEKYWQTFRLIDGCDSQDNFLMRLSYKMIKSTRYQENKHLYFLLTKDNLIKIGVSINVEDRIKDIENSIGKKIKVIKTLEYCGEFENKLHKTFSHLNSDKYIGTDGGTEWFQYNDELSEFIDELDSDNIEIMINIWHSKKKI